MSQTEPVADGSSHLDAPEPVVIDPDDDLDQMRYRCPNGHANWEPTNNHIWCQTCARQSDHDDSVDAEHYGIRDEKTDREISWEYVEFEG